MKVLTKPMDEWIKNMNDIGSDLYKTSIIDQAIARRLSHQKAWIFNCWK